MLSRFTISGQLSAILASSLDFGESCSYFRGMRHGRLPGRFTLCLAAYCACRRMIL